MDEHYFKQMASQLRKPEGEEGIKTGEWMNSGNLQINKDALRSLNVRNGESILEIGMGNGLFVGEILKDKPLTTYTGCDFSDVMVQEAKKINAAWISKGQADFVNADIASLPFGENTFDKLLTVNTIYFWDNDTAILKELKRVLKPGALLIIALRPKHQMIHYPFTQYGFKMYSAAELTTLLNNNGIHVKTLHENREPDYELNGEKISMENIVLVCSEDQSATSS